MTSPQQFEILDLRHFSARQLRPLLEQEADAWNQRLRWDYRQSTELLLQYLDSRILPGFVALVRGRICGFCFCVYEGQKAVVGDIYASRHESDPLAIVETLSRHLLETLESSPETLRIEAQLLLYDEGVLPPIFSAAISPQSRINIYTRLFLELDLSAGPAPAHPGSTAPTPARRLLGGKPETRQATAAAAAAHAFLIPPELELCRWSPTFYQPVAELIQRAYAGHLDSDINDQYRTLAGSQRFLHNIIRFPGCGTFDGDCSYVLRERSTNTPVGVLLCSRVAPDTAHVTQLCLDSAWRGRQLGRALLSVTLDHLPTRRYRYLTLTVSEANTPAVELYRSAGFHTRRRFNALVIDILNKRPRLSSTLSFLPAR